MYKFTKKLLFTFIIISLFIAMPKQVLANIPNFIGHVYYANQDGSKTNRGIPGIYIQWSDDRGHRRFAKTDQNGKFNFIEFARARELAGMSPEDYVRKEHRTWIKPEEPEILELYNQSNPDQDLSSQGYVRKFSADLHETALTCSTNPQTFTIIQPKAWLGGDVVDAETDWYTEIAGTGYRSRVIRPGVVGDVVLNNGNNHPGQKFIANFWYKLPPAVGGQVTTNDNQPIPGVTVKVTKLNGESKSVTTEIAGSFMITGFLNRDEIYHVRIENAPSGFKLPAKTTTIGNTWQWVNPNNQNDSKNHDTGLNSQSYENQKFGRDDCSSAPGAGPEAGQARRCNFKVAATFSTPPPGSAGVCTDIPVNNVLFKNKSEEQFPLPLTSTDSTKISLGKPEGFSTYDIYMAININESCKFKTLRFNFVSLRSPIPSVKPFIRTESGDVHSNVKIEQ